MNAGMALFNHLLLGIKPTSLMHKRLISHQNRPINRPMRPTYPIKFGRTNRYMLQTVRLVGKTGWIIGKTGRLIGQYCRFLFKHWHLAILLTSCLCSWCFESTGPLWIWNGHRSNKFSARGIWEDDRHRYCSDCLIRGVNISNQEWIFLKWSC